MQRLLRGPIAVAVFAAMLPGPAAEPAAAQADAPTVEWLKGRAPGAASPPSAAAPTRQGVMDAVERLKREVALLSRLRDSQRSLLEWNTGRRKAGMPVEALPRTLCAHPEIAAWCGRLPVTFGTAEKEEKR